MGFFTQAEADAATAAGVVFADGVARGRISNGALYGRLTALAAAATGRNLAETRPLTVSPAYQLSTAYRSGQVVSNAGGLFVAVGSGTSAASGSGPTNVTIGDSQIDATGSTLYWQYIGSAEITAADSAAPAYSRVSSVPADLTGGDLRPGTAAQIGFRGCTPSVVAGNKSGMPVYEVKAGSLEYAKGSFAVFMTDAEKFAVEQTNNNSPLRVAIDDRYYSTGALVDVATGSSQYHVFDFSAVGGKKTRKIELDYGRGATSNGATVGRIYIPLKGTLWAPSAGLGLRAAFVSDSIFDGSANGPTLPGNTVPNIVSRLLGWSDPWNFSKGGTGWLNTGDAVLGPFYTYRQRLPQVLAKNPDVIVIGECINDTTFSAAAITAEVTATLQAIRAGGSQALVIVWGSWSINKANLLETEDAVAAGVAAFIDPLKRTFFIPGYRDAVQPWLTGTWNNSATPGANNQSYYMSNDNVHPPELGTTYIGFRLARAISDIAYPALLTGTLT